jgi:hypothetical protein
VASLAPKRRKEMDEEKFLHSIRVAYIREATGKLRAAMATFWGAGPFEQYDKLKRIVAELDKES